MNPSYLDFELEIGVGQGRDYPVAVLRSPAGEARATMRLPFDEIQLESRLKDLQIALLRSGGTRRRALSQEEQTVVNFGRALFDALLAGEVRSLYDVSRSKADQAGQGLRLKLRIASPYLAALPWEFLYDGRRAEFVCLSVHTPVVRYIELPHPPQPLLLTPPLRILGMIASPSDAMGLDVDREQQRVEQALAGLIEQGVVELEWLAGQTWRDLQRAMRRGPWNIFHFVGHGEFDANADEGLILLCDDQGRARRFRASELGRMLADHRSLRLAILNACEGARGSERDIFSSTASILVQRGLPAVLAMQYEITDRAAIELSRAFYEALAEGWPVDAAVAEARRAVSWAVANTVEWGTPVLTMRAPDGLLFALDDAVSLVKPQPALARSTPAVLPPPGQPARAPQPGPLRAAANNDLLTLSEPLRMELVRVPAGQFLMGSDPTKDTGAYAEEQPQHPVRLDEFYIGKVPVTNAQYGVFVEAAKHQAPSHWAQGAPPSGQELHPVVNVSWQDAVAFCRWLASASGRPFRLPSEAEWEKAASWDEKARQKRIWPWGDAFDAAKCNSKEGGKGSTTPVDAYSPAGDSAYGVADMSGNVWEWCQTKWRDNYSTPPDDDPTGDIMRVVRGGSFSNDAGNVRCAVRNRLIPNNRYRDYGFRVVVASP